MHLVESERLEIKSKITDRLCRTVIAFANNSGGNIYIGIDDFGRVIGVDDIDGEMLRASNMLTDRVRPSVSDLVEIEPIDCDGKQLIKIIVDAGDDAPYYLASKGLTPSGVFTRLGPATVPMDRRDIRRMIREADGISFESEHCARQNLTFDIAQTVFAKGGVPFERTALSNLGIVGKDGFYTNLALLISDQNPFDLRCAVFNDDAFTELIDRIDCEGSIFTQIEEAERFLDTANGLKSYFVPGKLERIDKYDYPKPSVREAVLNAVVHRDYDPGTPALIKMNRTAIQFTNYGGLKGITVEQAVNGTSEARNPALRHLVYRLGIVEALGTGLKSIFGLYRAEELAPVVDSIGNWFYLTLPNVNTTRNPFLSLRRNDGPSLRGDYNDYERLDDGGMLPPDVSRAFAPIRQQHEKMRAGAEPSQAKARSGEERPPSSPSSSTPPLGGARFAWASGSNTNGDDATRLLIEFGRCNGDTFSRLEAEEVLGIGRDGTLKVIKGMLDAGAITKEGQARATRYRVAQ